MPIYLKGLIIGFILALPVGPVAILCIHRTLAEGRRNGILSGLGAATADTIYGTIAALGLTMVSGFIKAHETAFLLCGGLGLCALGIRTFLSKGQAPDDPSKRVLRGGNFVSAFLMTLMNPLTVLIFMAVFAYLGLSGGTEFSESLLIAGVFCGACLWWLTLCLLAGLFRTLVNEEHMGTISKIAGVLIVLSGLLLMLQSKFKYLRF